MDGPSRRYHDTAKLFRKHARDEGSEIVPVPATTAEIEEAERALGAALPEGFRWFQLEFGDVRDAPLEIYTVRTPESGSWNIIGINNDARTELWPKLPPHLIAFSDNGGGDYLCFDTSRRTANECPVVWWDHEGDEDQVPEPAAPSFLDWMDAELRERAAEERGSLLDNLPYKHWIDTWTRQFGGRPDDPNESSR